MKKHTYGKQNWSALCKLATCTLEDFYRKQANLTAEEALKSLNLPCTPFLIRLAVQAGFKENLGYGHEAYGIADYGSNRKYSDGKSEVRRKVTSVGQLYYRGFRYTLGFSYSNKLVRILEIKDGLIVICHDLAPLTLTRRRFLPT